MDTKPRMSTFGVSRARCRGGRIIDITQFRPLLEARGITTFKDEFERMDAEKKKKEKLPPQETVDDQNVQIEAFHPQVITGGQDKPVEQLQPQESNAGEEKSLDKVQQKVQRKETSAGRGKPVPTLQKQSISGLEMAMEDRMEHTVPVISSGRGKRIELMLLQLNAGRGMPTAQSRLKNNNVGRGLPYKLTAGRGMTMLSDIEKKNSPPHGLPEVTVYENKPSKKLSPDDSKQILEQEVSAFEATSGRCLIRITLNYFSQDNDVEFYVETVMEAALKSPEFVEELTMCLTLLTLLKKHGQEIKMKMFSKLQAMFEKMQDIMEEHYRFSEEQIRKLCNFCDLMGQIYFRFRPRFDASIRFNVLAVPTARCMKYLLLGGGVNELRTLLKLIILNFKSLYEGETKSDMERLSVDAHELLMKRDRTKNMLSLTMCINDFLTLQGNKLPLHLSQFYTGKLGDLFPDIAHESQSVIQILSDIPSDLTPSDMEMFGESLGQYNQYKSIQL